MRELVLDLSRLLPGPLAAKILASMNFRILRLLPPQGDALQSLSPELFAWLNDNAQAEILDLKTNVGRSRLLSLVSEAKIVIENNLPGVMERLGVGPDVLRAINARLAYVRVAGYREQSFHKSPGHDLNYLASAGLLSHLEPAWRRFQFADIAGAFWTVIAALEGLRQGGGEFEVYMADAAFIFGYPELSCCNGSRVCYTTYRCNAGVVALAALEPHLWHRLCIAMRHEEWIDKAFSDATPDNPVYCELSTALSERSAEEWEAWAIHRAVPLSAVRSYDPTRFPQPWKRIS